MEALIGKLGGKTTPATDPGLQPNKFALQMYGPAASIQPRTAPLGFNAPSLAAQIPQGAAPAAAPASEPHSDPWASMGPIGAFFKMITQQSMGEKLANGYPFISSVAARQRSLTDNSSGN